MSVQDYLKRKKERKKESHVELKRSQQMNKSKQNNRSGPLCLEVSEEHTLFPKIICACVKRGTDPFLYYPNQILLPQVGTFVNVL